MSPLEKDINYYKNQHNIIDLLAKRLAKGQVCLLVGAGVSKGVKLPGWDKLVSDMHDELGADFDPKSDPSKQTSTLKNKFFRANNDGYKELVHKHLYASYEGSLKELSENRLLRAIGALCMASHRGSVTNVINFNFDDTLETYLEYHGYVALSISDPVYWEHVHDVKVIHPHGFLPHNNKRSSSDDIVFARGDFFKAMNGKDGWRPIIERITKTHVLLLVGLSGDDINLESLIQESKAMHPTLQEDKPYFGYNLARDTDDRDTLLTREIYDNEGIYTVSFENYDKIPDFLFEICQRAAEQHTQKF